MYAQRGQDSKVKRKVFVNYKRYSMPYALEVVMMNVNISLEMSLSKPRHRVAVDYQSIKILTISISLKY